MKKNLRNTKYEILNTKRGFTLIELLVTASIIGVLMMVGLVIYQSSTQAARDARRREDLQGIQKAMEQYYIVAGGYPANCPAAGASFSDPNSDILLEAFPDDPLPAENYVGTCDSSRYCFAALMENNAKGNCGGCTCPGGTESCSFSAGTTHFCAKHAQ